MAKIPNKLLGALWVFIGACTCIHVCIRLFLFNDPLTHVLDTAFCVAVTGAFITGFLLIVREEE